MILIRHLNFETCCDVSLYLVYTFIRRFGSWDSINTLKTVERDFCIIYIVTLVIEIIRLRKTLSE